MTVKRMLLGCSVLLALGAGLFFFLPLQGQAATALVRLDVKGMTCGSCISNITGALAGRDGVGPVDVNLTLGQTRIEYDPSETSPERLAELVTSAGYPASIGQVLSASDFASLKQQEAQLAGTYVGRVGETLISRESFMEELSRQRTGDPRQDAGLEAKVWAEMQQRALLLEAASRAQVVVQDTEVQYEIDQLRAKKPELEAWIASNYPSDEVFFKRMKERMLINRLIEEQVIAGIEDPSAQQMKINNWFAKISSEVPQAVYDPQLKALLSQGGGGCGSCGSGGCGSRKS